MNDEFYTTSPSDTYDIDTEPAELSPKEPADHCEEARRAFSRLGFAIAALTLSLLVFQIVLDALLRSLIPQYATSWWGIWVLSLVPLYAFAMPLMLLALKGTRKAPHNTLYRNGLALQEKPRFTLPQFLPAVVITLGVMYIGNYIGTFVMSVLSAVTGYPYANALNSMVSESPLWVTVLCTCVCAPIGEEFLFRKLLIDRTRRYGDGVSILFSGLMFGLFHGNLFQFFYAFLLGMIAAYLYTRTGKLLWSIALHAVANLVGGVLMPALAGLVPTDPEAIFTPTAALASLLLVAIVFGLMIAGGILLFKLRPRYKFSPGEAYLSVRDCGGPVFSNPGMIAALILLAAMMGLALIPT